VRLVIRALFALPLLLYALTGCAGLATTLQARQQAVQDCILAGGHPRPGPGDTVICLP
jgi:hypothetical protein